MNPHTTPSRWRVAAAAAVAMATAAEPAVKLTVPLAVEIGTGKSWGAAH